MPQNQAKQPTNQYGKCIDPHILISYGLNLPLLFFNKYVSGIK